jgi:hypothetical protein
LQEPFGVLMSSFWTSSAVSLGKASVTFSTPHMLSDS